MDNPGRHPYFDDRGAAPWFVTMDAGLAAAAAAGRRVLLVLSRPDCGGSRAAAGGTSGFFSSPLRPLSSASATATISTAGILSHMVSRPWP